MKSLFFIKLLVIFYLCISQSAIQCMQDRRVKKILHKSHKLKHYNSKSTFQAKMAVYMRVASLFQFRDQHLSQFKDVNAQMLIMWQYLQADGTVKETVDKQTEDVKKLYDAHIKENEKKPDQLELIQKEMDQFFENFAKARTIDEAYERNLVEQKKIEAEEAKIPSNDLLNQEQKDSELELTSRKKFKLQDLILKGQNDLLKLFTDFLHPKQDATLFYKNVLKAIQSSMPDKFCYKKSSSLAPVQKLTCPTTHPNASLGFCYESCDQGQQRTNKMPDSRFEKLLGVCWEQCDNSKQKKCSKLGPIIYPEGKSWWNWHWQRSFIPDFVTVFNDKVACQPGEKKWGFLCYSNMQTCSEFGYQECLLGTSCSLNNEECSKVKKNMLVSTVIGISKFAMMFVAPGASTILEITNGIIAGLSAFESLVQSMKESRSLLQQVYENPKLKERLIKDTVKTLKNEQQNVIDGVILNDKQIIEKIEEILAEQMVKVKAGETRKTLLEKIRAKLNQAQAITKVAGVGADQVKTVQNAVESAAGTVNTVVETIKQNTSDKVFQGIKTVTDSVVQAGGETLQDILKAGGQVRDIATEVLFDFSLALDVVDVVKSCTNKEKNVECAKAILGAVAVFDPTGLAGIAKAFLYNTCKDLSDP